VLKDRVPGYVQDIFERRLAGKGLGLNELAVLASTIEHLIHSEALARMGEIFKIHEQSLTGLLGQEEVNDILESYMIQYLYAVHIKKIKNITLKKMQRIKKQFNENNTVWKPAREFIRQVQTKETGNMQTMDFAAVLRIAERLGEQWGRFQSKDCTNLKDSLVALEDRGSGRVKLPDFYRGDPDHTWTFDENVDYLRLIGALDETFPENPRIIIPNYVASRSNCLNTLSSYYSTCCIDECEDIINKIESHIKAPEATPAQIVDAAVRLPSSPMAASSALSAKLRLRLDEIATMHGGVVPLHGRLFAQWMHHAYPRDCPYPFPSGTTINMRQNNWETENSRKITVTDEEKARIIEDGQAAVQAGKEFASTELIPWLPDEELIAKHAFSQSRSTYAVMRTTVAFLAAASVSIVLVGRLKTITSCFKTASKFGMDSSHKYYV
jgi:hypothetical protein